MQGESAPAPGEMVALHEAGHAVAALVLGVGRVRSVSIEPDRQGELGRVLWVPERPRVAVVYMAGPAAVAVIGGGRWPALAGAGGDIGNALTDVLGASPAADFPAAAVAAGVERLDQAWLQAVDLITHHAAEVRAGAAALLARGTLSAAEFARAAGGQLAALAPSLEAADSTTPAMPNYVPVADCPICGWQLTLPIIAYISTPAGELDAWIEKQRPLLCRPEHLQELKNATFRPKYEIDGRRSRRAGSGVVPSGRFAAGHDVGDGARRRCPARRSPAACRRTKRPAGCN